MAIYDENTPAQQAIRNAVGQARVRNFPQTPPSQPPRQVHPVSDEPTTITEMIASIAADENADALRSITGVMNAITLMKQNVHGTPYWTVEDMKKFSLMVEALHSMRPTNG